MVSNVLLQRSSSPVRWWGPRRSPICSAGPRISAASASQSPAGPGSSRRRPCRSDRSSSRRSGRRSCRADRRRAGSSCPRGLRSSSGSLRRTPRHPARSGRARPRRPDAGDPGSGAGSRRTGGSGSSRGSRADSHARAVRTHADGRDAASPARAPDAGPEPGSGDDAAALASVAPGSAGRGRRARDSDRAAPHLGADPPQAGAHASRRRHAGHPGGPVHDRRRAGRRERLIRRYLQG